LPDPGSQGGGSKGAAEHQGTDPRALAATISNQPGSLPDPALAADATQAKSAKPAKSAPDTYSVTEHQDIASTPQAPHPAGRAIVAKPQQHSPEEESGNAEVQAKATPPPAGEKRPNVDRSASGGDSVTFDPQIEPASSSRTQDTGTLKPAADPPPTTKLANEPEINAAPQQPQAARQISVKLTGEDATRVDIEVTDRAGKVLVAVRTPDQDLAKSLQTDLGTLVGRLDEKGYKPEAWVPAISHAAAAAPEQSNGNGPGNSRQSGSEAGGQGGQGKPGQNGSNQRQQARWMAQVEETLSTVETETENE